MPTPKEIQKLSLDKAIKLEQIINEIEKRISKSSSKLTKTILKEFINKLSFEQGRIVDRFDSRTATLFNQAYGQFSNGAKMDLTKSIVIDIDNILEDNSRYYNSSIGISKKDIDDIKWIVNRRLGIDQDGNLLKDGYMSGLLDDRTIKADLQKHIFKEMFKGVGPEALKKSIKLFIEGDKKRLGHFERYYKSFSFDVYAQLNSYTGALYAERLGLEHFIYNGGIIKTSREFCRMRNGKVFSTAEAELWVNDPTLTAVTDIESYNWVLDRGGYNCRHSIDWIASEVAYVLRPELKDQDDDRTKNKISNIVKALSDDASKNLNIDFSGGLVEIMQWLRKQRSKVLSKDNIEKFREVYNFAEYLKSKGTLFRSSDDIDKFTTPHGRKELDTIKKLLDRGLDFYVMPNSAIGKKNGELQKNLDGIIFNNQNYRFVEIKTLTTGSMRTVRDRIYDAAGQSNRILLDVTGSISNRDLAIGIRTGFINNKDIRLIQVLKGKKLISISRYEANLNQKKFIELFTKKMR